MTTPKQRRQRRLGNTRKNRKPPKADPAIGREIDLVIETIGHGGDGFGHFNNMPVFVPFALPGDQLTVRLIARRGNGFVASIQDDKAKMPRATPPCPHFERCGGCQLQHLPADDYTGWLSDQVEKALLSRGVADIEIRPLIEGIPATRRRLRLAFERHGSGLKQVEKVFHLGFRERHSRTILPISNCPVALPALTALLPPLETLLCQLDMAENGGEILLTATDTGIDLLLQANVSPNLADLEALGAFANEHDLARLAWRLDVFSPAEPIAARRPVRIKMGGIAVDLPIGAFLQATHQTETAIRQAISEALGNSQRLIDLFAGCGAFSLPFAATGRKVSAFERDKTMVEALKRAARLPPIDRNLRAEARDLDRDPLQASELSDIDAVILDPPRAGARTQVQALATSEVKKIAMVSCNPATFARDARSLIGGGYRLLWVQPIDAFLWSAQIELVGAFERHIPS